MSAQYASNFLDGWKCIHFTSSVDSIRTTERQFHIFHHLMENSSQSKTYKWTLVTLQLFAKWVHIILIKRISTRELYFAVCRSCRVWSLWRRSCTRGAFYADLRVLCSKPEDSGKDVREKSPAVIRHDEHTSSHTALILLPGHRDDNFPCE